MIEEKKIELKPCPFCGGKAIYHRTPVRTNGRWCDSVTVKCERCEAKTNRILYDKKKHGEDGEYDEAREAWNRRVDDE